MVVTVTGDNQHMVVTEVKSIIDGFVAKHGKLTVERFDAEEADAEHILDTTSAISLLSANKLVVIQNFERNKVLVEKIESLVEETPDETTLLIEIGKLDKRARYGKFLKQHSDFREFTVFSPQEMVTWVVQTTKDKGGDIDKATTQYLLDFIGSDQTRLSNELDKLIIFDQHIRPETIDLLCEKEPTSTVFELLDAGFNGQKQKALSLYEEQRQQQLEPLAIIGMIGWQIHILAVVKTAKGRSARQIAQEAGLHPFVVQKSLKLVQKMTLQKLRVLVHRAVELEVEIKHRTMNADDAVKHFLLILTTS